MTFEVLRSRDSRIYEEIIRRSDVILDKTLESEKAGAELWAEYRGRGDWFGTGGYCSEVSDAVTRAAHDLGIVASREALDDSFSFHYVTCFAPLDQLPTEEDLILCRTWGQLDPALYMGSSVYSWKPFFGTRRELAALLPAEAHTFRPEAVVYRQIVHGIVGPNEPHIWLHTTPTEIASGKYTIGTATKADHPGRDWS